MLVPNTSSTLPNPFIALPLLNKSIKSKTEPPETLADILSVKLCKTLSKVEKSFIDLSTVFCVLDKLSINSYNANISFGILGK